MNATITVVSIVLALAWLPLAGRFLRGWRNRKNPVSLAICAAVCLFAYTEILFALAINEQSSWQFYAVATHVFNAVVVGNFYLSFRWSERRFPEQRRGAPEYSVPPTNTTNTPRST